MKFRAYLPLLLLGFAIAAFTGCSDNGRVGAKGKVTVNGEPLAEGMITFEPQPGFATNSAGAKITAAEYEISSEPGLQPGHYRVNVKAFLPTGRKINDPQRGRIDELVPARFKDAGKLEAVIEADGENRHDFALSTIPTKP